MSNSRPCGSIKTTWRIATYDVWGNAKDGYEINDVYRGNEIELFAPVTLFEDALTPHAGIPQFHKSAHLTDRQIRKVFGLGKTRIDVNGDDVNYFITRSRDNYPLGELVCTSHESLSPIKPLPKDYPSEETWAI